MTPPTNPMPTQRPAISQVRWRVLWLSVVVSFVAYILRSNLSIAAPAVVRDFGLSEVQLGIAFSAFAWCYALGQLPGGVWGGRIGARKATTIILVGWSVITILTALVPGPARFSVLISLGVLSVLRGVLGLVQAPLYPVFSGCILPAWFPPAAWGVPNGLSSSGLTLGAAATGPILGYLIDTVGWRAGLLITAPAGLILAVIWWWYFRDDPAEHRSVSPGELELIRTDQLPITKLTGSGWLAAVANREVLAITFSYFCMNYVFYLFFNWFFYYLVEIRRLPSSAGGWFSGAQWVVGAIAAFLGGWLCDWLSRLKGRRFGCQATAIGGLLATAPFLIAGALTTSPPVAVALLSLSFGCTQLTEGAFWTAVMRVAGPNAPAATGLMNTGGNAVGGVGAILVPLVAGGFGWTTAVSTGAIFAVAGALPWFWLKLEPPAPATQTM